jgi:hypothetical protein
VASELEIADRVAHVERLERRFHDLRRQVDELIEQNDKLKTELAGREANQKRLRDGRSSLKPADQKRLDEQIKQQQARIDDLKKSIVPPDKLGGTAPLKGVILELVGVRSDLAFHLLALRRQIEGLPALYGELRKNPEVTAALSSLEPPGQLAPARSFAGELRTLARIEKLIFADELPLYREGKQFRIAAIANEELPMTLTLFESTEPTVITHAMAQSLGLATEDGAKRDLRLDNRHNVKVYPAKLTSLRFGRHLLGDIEVLVLSPENENLGARIGLAAFRGLRVRIVPERLQVRLESTTAKSEK